MHWRQLCGSSYTWLVLTLVSTPLSAVSIIFKQGRCAMMCVRRKQSANNDGIIAEGDRAVDQVSDLSRGSSAFGFTSCVHGAQVIANPESLQIVPRCLFDSHTRSRCLG